MLNWIKRLLFWGVTKQYSFTNVDMGLYIITPKPVKPQKAAYIFDCTDWDKLTKRTGRTKQEIQMCFSPRLAKTGVEADMDWGKLQRYLNK